MAVRRIPLLLKLFFPALFLVEFVRHYFFYRMIVHRGPSYQKACKELLDHFIGQVRQTLADLPSNNPGPTILEFGAGPYPAFEAYPNGTHLICVDPCSDFNDLLLENWNKSHLARNGKLTVINCKIEDLDSAEVNDNSIDLVLSLCTNCSVTNIDETFKTVHRVLKFSGRYFFWDHVRSDHWKVRFFQYIASLPLFSFFTDCNPARKPFDRLKSVGFTDVVTNYFETPLTGFIVQMYRPTASGYAVK